MDRRTVLGVVGAAPAAMFAAQGGATRSDWPQWRGPNRDGRSPETGLMRSWPASGPPLVWSVKGLGAGYGSLCVAGDSIYLHGAQPGASVVHCLDRASGKTRWTQPLGRTRDQDRGPGPRATPTYEAGRLYCMSEDGELAVIEAANGKKIWQKNVLTGFGGSNPHWLLSESPLIEAGNVIITPGGRNASIAALDKATGQTRWTSQGLSDRAGYASCIAATVGNVRVILALTSEAGVGVRASDGKPQFRFEAPANGTANCTTPVYFQNRVFYTSAYGTGALLAELEAVNGEVKAKEVYFSREMQNHHGGVVLHEGHLYGCSNQILTCMEFSSGKVKWKDRAVGKGSLAYADGHLYVLSENQTMGLVEATAEGYREKGRFRIGDEGLPSWAHPVISQGCLFLRNQGVVSCYRLTA